MNLKHKHMAASCGNTSTVSWARHMTSSPSKIGHRLVRALMMGINVSDTSLLMTVSIQGCHKDMADVSSWSFIRRPGSKTSSKNFEVCHFFDSSTLSTQNFPSPRTYNSSLSIPSEFISDFLSSLPGAASTATDHGLVAMSYKERQWYWGACWSEFFEHCYYLDPT